MDPTEKIQAHLLSVLKEEKKLFSKGRECMFFVTDKHLAFVTKTEANPKWWKSAAQRQIFTLGKSDNTMITHDGYDEKHLLVDLENEKNEEYLYEDVISAESQKKPWGTVLLLKIRMGEKEKTFQLSVVKDWVSYPIKDAVKFLTVDWTPIVTYIKQRITN
jgi:hypothetical protein